VKASIFRSIPALLDKKITHPVSFFEPKS